MLPSLERKLADARDAIETQKQQNGYEVAHLQDSLSFAQTQLSSKAAHLKDLEQRCQSLVASADAAEAAHRSALQKLVSDSSASLDALRSELASAEARHEQEKRDLRVRLQEVCVCTCVLFRSEVVSFTRIAPCDSQAHSSSSSMEIQYRSSVSALELQLVGVRDELSRVTQEHERVVADVSLEQRRVVELEASRNSAQDACLRYTAGPCYRNHRRSRFLCF